jgi:predicted nucleic acid-binding Zn ribbon protein
VRRQAPRSLAAALTELEHEASPPGLLAQVQAHWQEVVGDAVAGEAKPVSERAGTVVVACRSAAWAQELTLLESDLRERLNAALGDRPGGCVARLRFRPGHPRQPSRASVL